LSNSPISIDCLETVSLPTRNVFDKQLGKLEELFRPHAHAHYDQDGVINDGGTLFLDVRVVV